MAAFVSLKDGKIVFAIQEERLSLIKYDGGSWSFFVKILNYTSKLDYSVIAYTYLQMKQRLRVDFTGDDVYTGPSIKLGLIGFIKHISIFTSIPSCRLVHMHQITCGFAFYSVGLKLLQQLLLTAAFIHKHGKR